MGATGRNISKSTLEALDGQSLAAHLTREMLITNGAKVGATAGATVAAASNTGVMATVAAGSTAATIVVRLNNLPVGAKIRAFRVYGQIESGGNVATVDAALWKVTLAAADPVEAAVSGAGITQVSVTADAVLNATKTGLSEEIAVATGYYLLITVTTGASTDVQLAGVGVTIY